MIWKVKPTPEQMNAFGANTIEKHLGIEFLEIGPDFLRARMPVDSRTKQPFGLLHGGASVVLAETLGSSAAFLCIDIATQIAVGQEVNANHLRSVREGYVYGTAKPLHIGNSTHVWNIEIRDEEDNLVCVSRITMAIRQKRQN